MATANPTVKAVLNHLLQNGGGKSKIIEEWREGSEWYRVWSNGLIEQGGAGTSASSGGLATLTFKKPFSTSDYNIVGITTGSSVSVAGFKCTTKASTSVTLKLTWQQDGGGGPLNNASYTWTAIGF